MYAIFLEPVPARPPDELFETFEEACGYAQEWEEHNGSCRTGLAPIIARHQNGLVLSQIGDISRQ
jgi:hypothetical protein